MTRSTRPVEPASPCVGTNAAADPGSAPRVHLPTASSQSWRCAGDSCSPSPTPPSPSLQMPHLLPLGASTERARPFQPPPHGSAAAAAAAQKAADCDGCSRGGSVGGTSSSQDAVVTAFMRQLSRSRHHHMQKTAQSREETTFTQIRFTGAAQGRANHLDPPTEHNDRSVESRYQFPRQRVCICSICTWPGAPAMRWTNHRSGRTVGSTKSLKTLQPQQRQWRHQQTGNFQSHRRCNRRDHQQSNARIRPRHPLLRITLFVPIWTFENMAL